MAHTHTHTAEALSKGSISPMAPCEVRGSRLGVKGPHLGVKGLAFPSWGQGASTTWVKDSPWRQGTPSWIQGTRLGSEELALDPRDLPWMQGSRLGSKGVALDPRDSPGIQGTLTWNSAMDPRDHWLTLCRGLRRFRFERVLWGNNNSLTYVLFYTLLSREGVN